MTDTLTPLFLDVDGVLNVVPYNNHRGKWDDFETRPVQNGPSVYNLTISRKCCDALAELPLDIRWLTTWGNQANLSLSDQTGFLTLPVQAEMPPMGRYMWKHDAVEQYLATEADGNDRFVWIDDDAIPVGAEKLYPNALLIRTELDEGITPEHIELISDYLTQVS